MSASVGINRPALIMFDLGASHRKSEHLQVLLGSCRLCLSSSFGRKGTSRDEYVPLCFRSGDAKSGWTEDQRNCSVPRTVSGADWSRWDSLPVLFLLLFVGGRRAVEFSRSPEFQAGQPDKSKVWLKVWGPLKTTFRLEDGIMYQ